MMPNFGLSLGVIAVVCLAVWPATSPAQSGITLPPPNLDSYCIGKANRQTVIYVDRGSLTQGDAQWATRLYRSLSYTPHERVQVILFDPASGSVEPRFNLCYPGYTPEELSSMNASVANRTKELVAGSHDVIVKRDQELFLSRLATAFSGLVKLPNPATGAAERPIAETLARDQGRLSSGPAIPRIYIVSSMRQSGVDPTRPEDKAADMARRNRLDFRNGQIQIVTGAAVMDNPTKRFWQALFQRSGASVEGFATPTDLAVKPNRSESMHASNWLGLIIQREPAPVKIACVSLQVRVEDSGEIRSGWMSIPDVGQVPFTGSFRCSSQQSCELQGRLKSDLPAGEPNPANRYLMAQDTIVLTGSSGYMTGQIAFPEVNGQRARPSHYELRLQQSRSDCP